MAEVIDIPSRGVSAQVQPREIYAQLEPTDRQVWALCPYLRKLERCMGCPDWEEDGPRGKVKRGCRALAEEACRVVVATQHKEPSF